MQVFNFNKNLTKITLNPYKCNFMYAGGYLENQENFFNTAKKKKKKKKKKFSIKISSVSVTKSAANCGFDHIY